MTVTDHTPDHQVIAAITLNVRYFDDELTLSDFINDVDNLISGRAAVGGVSEHFLTVLDQIATAIAKADWDSR